MAITYTDAVKNSRLDTVTTALGAGAGSPSGGVLEIGTAAMAAVLAQIPLAIPAAPAASGGVLTFTMPRSASAIATGTAAAARLRDADNTDVATGLTVGTGGTDVVLDSTSITAGQTVTISTATITHG